MNTTNIVRAALRTLSGPPCVSPEVDESCKLDEWVWAAWPRLPMWHLERIPSLRMETKGSLLTVTTWVILGTPPQIRSV